MTSGEPTLLVEDFWLATTGPHQLPGASVQVRLGLAMAVIRDLERLGDIVWDGRGPETVVHIGAPDNCPRALRGWLELLGDYAGPDGSVPARFILDPLMDDLWHDVAHRLIDRRLAVRYARRFTPDLYAAANPANLRGWRQDVMAALSAGVELDERPLDLLLIAHSSHSLPELLRGPGIPLPPSLASAVGAVVRRDSVSAHRYRETVTHRDAAGWAYGPAALG